MILVIKHIEIEGPGTIAEFFKSNDRTIEVIDLSKTNKLPKNFSGIEASIILGGPMNVYEEAKYPFLKEENSFLKKAIEKEIPLLGICLGAQLLAKACGASVEKAKEKEVGWYTVSLTEDGKQDPLFEGLNETIDVFQWHEDTFQIPDKALLLATSKACKNQAFRFGKNVYGLQFHIEVTDNMIKAWIDEYGGSTEVITGYYKLRGQFNTQANTIYSNFLNLLA